MTHAYISNNGHAAHGLVRDSLRSDDEKSRQKRGEPLAPLHVRKSTSGKHHLARLALSRVEVKASEPSVIAAMEKVKEKERNPTSSESCEKNQNTG